MKIVVTGATGLIGKPLCRRLLDQGHELIILTRSSQKTEKLFPDSEIISWDAISEPPPARLLQGVEAAIHLAGESVAGGRWSKQRKEAIRDSRVIGTRNLVEGLLDCEPRPGVLLSGSAIGFYGDTGEEEVDESAPPGDMFLSEVGKRWEEEALPAQEAGLRVVWLRTGVVLHHSGGALKAMLPPFKYFLGGPLGGGRQYISWIHLRDEVEAILHCLENRGVSGPVNLVAPNPVSNKEFSRRLGKVLGRPSFWPVPGFALKLMMGEMADELLLKGQRVKPKRLIECGYGFRFENLREALEDLLA